MDKQTIGNSYQRERQARLKAEELLENKTREIFIINEQLKQQTQALAQSNEELTQFAFIASHDLKEPLRKIKTFCSFLRDEYSQKLDDTGQDYIMRLNKATTRMDDLIEGLLHYARITRSNQPYEAIDLPVLLEEVLADLSIRIEETGAKIDTKGLSCRLVGDATQIRQLLQNIIGNSLKFRRPNLAPKITVTSNCCKDAENNQLCEITISDNGIGFDEKYSDKIFGIFQRLHGQSEFEGYGIGLAVCKRIVERHHGTIAVHSKPQCGTTFIISLPLKEGG